jgi:hypothetical protein
MLSRPEPSWNQTAVLVVMIDNSDRNRKYTAFPARRRAVHLTRAGAIERLRNDMQLMRPKTNLRGAVGPHYRFDYVGSSLEFYIRSETHLLVVIEETEGR